MSYTINPFYGKLDATRSDSEITTLGDVRYLKLTTEATEATILATTPTVQTLAFATDTHQFYLYSLDDAGWMRLDIKLFEKSALPDRGAETDSVKSGYHDTYVTDKRLFQCVVGGNVRTEDGAIKNVDGVFSIYDEGSSTYEVIVKNLVLVEDETTGRMFLVHKPIGHVDYLSTSNEDSVLNLAGNGLPVTQGGLTDRGALPVPQIIDGGTF